MIRILIADDSTQFRVVACEWIAAQPGLELAGQVLNGREAVEAIDRVKPDVVLMDAVMPEMDGFEATRQIKALPNAPMVVILTLHDSETMRRAAEIAGADGFVGKGEFVEALTALLENLTDSASGTWQ